MGSRQEKDKAVNVQVLLRCRPFSEDELRSNAPQVLTCNDSQREVAVTQNIAGKQIDRVFTFDKVFGPSAKQRDLYDQAVIPIVNEVLEGFNCTIFAYGQTGTGKTYTMEGECRRAKSGPNCQLHPDAGVIPRAVKQIFDTLEGQSAEYSVKVSFIELYNEEITDLLAPEELSKIVLEEKQKKALPLMEDGKGGVLVRGLEEEIVTNAGEIFSLLERGSAKRRTAETLLNKQSSRSHSLFTITIHIKEATADGEELIKSGKLNLVDLAGSENICRSGAREGRAREAGEINKSLLTLGRVITALVEHLGHIPYRDSKLTRLLRDSLGGRTKTCIIATVSPSVHCLEETLSTLDYAHRAKNIKNRPEVNQKMMKSTLIKDLYGEIDRLKAEVYAAREKVGVYIPKERYYQEESERKALTEQNEQLGVLLEANTKQIEELQAKYSSELELSDDLRKQLEAKEKTLEHTSKLLSTTKDELKQTQYNLKEKEFIISELKQAENALTHQAFVLRSDLERSLRDNDALYSKIDREDKLCAANRAVVNAFQVELASRMGTLSKTLVESMDQQNNHLKCVEQLCQSCLDFNDQAVFELEKKVLAMKSVYLSNVEAIQNMVRLHRANSNSSLEDISCCTCANFCSLDQLLAVGEGEANVIFRDLQKLISDQQCEMAHFARELRERFQSSLCNTKDISCFVLGLLDKLSNETSLLQSNMNRFNEEQSKSNADFLKAYKEKSRSEEEKLLSEITNLVSGYIHRQNKMVDVQVSALNQASVLNKAYLEEHTSRVNHTTSDAKRKWEEFTKQAEHDLSEGSSFSSEKHCRLELQLQKCVNAVDYASQQWKTTHASVREMCQKQVSEMQDMIMKATESNDQHDSEIASVRTTSEGCAENSSKDISHHCELYMAQGRASTSAILKAVELNSAALEELGADHASLTASVTKHADHVLQQTYKDYEPTGETPVRSEAVIPSKATIESLRSMPMEVLIEEFRENNPCEATKESKPSVKVRSPLVQLN